MIAHILEAAEALARLPDTGLVLSGSEIGDSLVTEEGCTKGGLIA